MRRTTIGLAVATVIAAAYLLSVPGAGNLQLVASALLLALYLVATLLRPTQGLVVVSATLPFLGMFRRILYQQSPVQLDPLLLVIPLYSVLLLVVISVAHREYLRALLRQSLTSRLDFFLTAVLALQIFNPLQGGLVVGVAGALFYLVPLSWFFIGRIFLTEQAVTRILTILVVASILAAGYGLMQTFVGFPGYDAYWIAQVSTTSYQALNVGGIRALGPTTSAAEYAAFLTCGLACLLALMVFRRNAPALIPAALLGVALFLESSRGPIMTVAVTFVALMALRQRSKAVAIALISVMCLAGVLADQYVSQLVYVEAPQSSSPIQDLLAHQINGLTHPLDHKYSTGQLHLQEIANAFGAILRNPLGFGLGATTLSAAKFGGSVVTSELDIPDVFLSGGVIAGLLYMAVLYRAFGAGLTLAFRYKRMVDVLPLATLAVTFGSILNGGFYSLMPFLWMFVAWLDRQAGAALTSTQEARIQRKVPRILQANPITLEQ